MLVALTEILRLYKVVAPKDDFSEEMLMVFDFKANVPEPSHLTLINVTESLIPRSKMMWIDSVHRQGLVHIGDWLWIMDSQQKVLTIQRGQQLVTCPGAWGLVGEHQNRDEDPIETARRAVREELGSTMLDHISFIEPLAPLPLYYIRDYGPTNGNRVDRQPTYIWWIQMDQPGSQLPLKLDDEVANHAWMSTEQLQNWFDEAHQRLETTGHTGTRLCHSTVLSLWETVMENYLRQKTKLQLGN